MTDQSQPQDVLTRPGDLGEPRGSRASLNEAFTVLADSVTALHTPDRAPTASEVRIEMRRRTWNGFDPELFGFTRFRDFVDAAANAGAVIVDREREGDIALAPVGAAPAPQGPAIRRDLYRAFVDWSINKLHLYHVPADRVIELPRHAAPLEPEHFAGIRDLQALRPDDYVEIPSTSMREQLDWMAEFANSREDPFVAESLHEALAAPKPARDFTNALRQHPYDHRAWKRDLQDRIRGKVEAWRDGARLDLDIEASTDDVEVGPDGGLASVAGSATRMANRDGGIVVAGTATAARNPTAGYGRPAASSRSSDGDGTVGPRSVASHDRELRARLHRAIDRMPSAELRGLRLPVGYLFED